ncbi:hypothetical protein BDZ91DRAFT_747324 [Kalaharituber pfeilii]|nr:hypothetical protein BDZ91DRAFT_747324 [Kalaharituber pfeilii]
MAGSLGKPSKPGDRLRTGQLIDRTADKERKNHLQDGQIGSLVFTMRPSAKEHNTKAGRRQGWQRMQNFHQMSIVNERSVTGCWITLSSNPGHITKHPEVVATAVLGLGLFWNECSGPQEIKDDFEIKIGSSHSRG